MKRALEIASVDPAIAALRPLAASETLRAAVVDHLRDAIVCGELAPSLLLREVGLAKQLGVSATPVREALSQLASEGLVEIEPNRLRRVAPLDDDSMVDLIVVQTALWRMAYERAFGALDAADIARLRQSVAMIAAGVKAGAISGAMDGMHQFNATLLARSGSPEITRLTRDRRALLSRHLVLAAGPLIDQTWACDHQAMVDAIERGNRAEFLARSDAMTARLLGQIGGARQG